MSAKLARAKSDLFRICFMSRKANTARCLHRTALSDMFEHRFTLSHIKFKTNNNENATFDLASIQSRKEQKAE